MPDLLSSLATANGSNKSFHSVDSSPATSTPNQKPLDVHSAALQAEGVAVYDLDAYMKDPNTQLLLKDSVTAQKGKTSSLRNDSSIGSGSSSREPVQLGAPKTSQHVKLLYEICQGSGLQLEFKIDGDPSGFGGWVSVNGEKIEADELWRSKKEAKEGLAEKGIELAQKLAQNPRSAQVAAATVGHQVNWIGNLLGKNPTEDRGRRSRLGLMQNGRQDGVLSVELLGWLLTHGRFSRIFQCYISQPRPSLYGLRGWKSIRVHLCCSRGLDHLRRYSQCIPHQEGSSYERGKRGTAESHRGRPCGGGR